MSRVRAATIWTVVAIVGVVPIIVAATSPLLEWRNSVYIAAGFGGVIALSFMFLQPMLAAGLLPGVSLARGRRVHRWVGSALVVSVLVHVIGLWITSPPDVVDALLFVSATPFSIWGVMAMWSVFISACLVLFRYRLHLSVRTWRLSHQCLAVVTVGGSVVHAMMIEGTMGMLSKSVLCALVVVVTGSVLLMQYKTKR